jgi:hypothetical protein
MASPRDLGEAVDSIRRAFDLDAVAVLCNTGTGWNVETAVGATQLQHPDQADYQVQIGTGRVLAIIDARRTVRDTAPLQAFLTELRLARGRALLQALPGQHTVTGSQPMPSSDPPLIGQSPFERCSS